ncbi:MAG: hypothetical protein VX278_21385 [Myxococcota bacterium]|nr:hypothetical protein [Myxococcota bacterium]
MKPWIIAVIVILAVVIPAEYYLWKHTSVEQSIEPSLPQKEKTETETATPETKTRAKRELQERNSPKEILPKANPTSDWPSVSWRFEGTLRKLKQMEIIPMDGGCGYKMNVRYLNWMGDRNLRKIGVQAQTPIIVYEDDTPLKPFAGRAEKWEQCEGKSDFYLKFVYFSPTSIDAFDPNRYRVALNANLPIRSAKQTTWWLYSGYTMQTTIPQAKERPGQSATIQVKMRIVGRDLPTAPIVSADARSLPLKKENDSFSGTLEIPLPQTQWPIAIKADAKGSYFIVETLTLSVGGETYNLLVP